VERRKIIIYIIFAVTVAYGIYFHLLSGETSPKKPGVPQQQAASPVNAQRQTVAPAMAAASIIPQSTPKTASKDKSIKDDWKRNPFARGRAPKIASPVKTARGVPIPRKPRVSAISNTKDGKMDIADGKILRIGESINKWTLVDIRDDAALFRCSAGSFWIKLGGK